MSPAKPNLYQKKALRSSTLAPRRKPRLHLQRTDQVGKGLRSIAIQQLRSAIWSLQGKDANPEAVHHTRTGIKKVRAIIGLFSASMVRSEKNRILTVLRDASVRLSGLRDSDVQVQTLDLLLKKGVPHPEAFQFLRNGLTDIARQRRGNDIRQIPRAQKLLNQALLNAQDWHPKGIGAKDLKRRIRRTYRAGRNSLKLCVSKEDPEHFHAWRKRVKQLWYQLRITADFWPGNADELIHDIGGIGELAGKERDLTLLAKTIARGAKSDEANQIIGGIAKLLPKLRKKAIADGLKFYKASPKAFADQMRP